MHRLVVALTVMLSAAACRPAATALTDEEKVAVESEVTAFAERIRTSVIDMDFEAVLDSYEKSEDLTAARRGNVYRSWSTWTDLLRPIFSRVASVEDCVYSDAGVQVLAADVAVFTGKIACSGTLGADEPVQTIMDHTITMVAVKRDGEWKTVNFSETFPTP